MYFFTDKEETGQKIILLGIILLEDHIQPRLYHRNHPTNIYLNLATTIAFLQQTTTTQNPNYNPNPNPNLNPTNPKNISSNPQMPHEPKPNQTATSPTRLSSTHVYRRTGEAKAREISPAPVPLPSVHRSPRWAGETDRRLHTARLLGRLHRDQLLLRRQIRRRQIRAHVQARWSFWRARHHARSR